MVDSGLFSTFSKTELIIFIAVTCSLFLTLLIVAIACRKKKEKKGTKKTLELNEEEFRENIEAVKKGEESFFNKNKEKNSKYL